MTQSIDEVLQAGLALPEDQRVELVEALIASFPLTDERPFEEHWLAEIQRRSAELDAGLVTPIPWSIVKERNRPGNGANG